MNLIKLRNNQTVQNVYEVKLIVMWQAQPELYKVTSKEYSNRIKRMLVVLAYNIIGLWPLPTTICPSVFSPVFVAADDATHNFLICYFKKKMRPTLIIVLLLLVSNNIG